MVGNRRETWESTSQTSVKWRKPAGDGTPFLVIQAISKKSSLRLTSISRLEKATWKIGTGAPPRIAVHQSADFPPFARDFGRSFTSFTPSRLSTTRTGRECSRSVDSQHDTNTRHDHGELDAALRVTTTSVLLKRLMAGLGCRLGQWFWCRGRRSVRPPAGTIGRWDVRPW